MEKSPGLSACDPSDETLERFKSHCRQAASLPIDIVRNWLHAIPADRQSDFAFDCMSIHLTASWNTEQPYLCEDYVAEYGRDFPMFSTLDRIDADFVDNEFVARYLGTSADFPTIDEYRQRFAERLDIHQLLEQRHFGEGRYLRLKPIGQGGFGIVWAAFDRKLKRQVALKFAREPARSEFERVRKEALTAAALEHPAIVTIHDCSAPESPNAYTVMRLVEGEDFGQLIMRYHRSYQDDESRSTSSKTPTQNQLLGIFEIALQAMAFAHSKSIAHGDLKPGNIRVGSFGEVAILDWGLSRTPSENLEGPDGGLGTPEFMPPEQLNRAPDTRSDVFCLGGILFQILTSRPPRNLDTQSTKGRYASIATMQIQWPNSLVGFDSDELKPVCLKALATTPEDRYPTASEMLADFNSARAASERRIQSLKLRTVRAKRLKMWLVITTAIALVLLGMAYRLSVSEKIAKLRADEAEQYAQMNSGLVDSLSAPIFNSELHVLRLPAREVSDMIDALQTVGLKLANSPRPDSQFDAARALARTAFLQERKLQHEAALRNATAALAVYRKLEPQAQQQRGLLVEQAYCLETLANIHQSLAQAAESERFYREAIDKWTNVGKLGLSQDTDWQQLTRCRANLAGQLAKLNRHQESLAELEVILSDPALDNDPSYRGTIRAMKANRTSNPSDYKQALDDFNRIPPELAIRVTTRKARAECLISYGFVLFEKNGDRDECMKMCDQALEILAALLLEFPQHLAFERLRALALINRALATDSLQLHDQTDRALTEAETILNRLASNLDVESQRKVATLYERKCLSLINAKRFDEAEAYLAKALAVNSTKESLLVLKASILAEQGDFSKVAEYIRGLKPIRPTSFYNLATICDVCQQKIGTTEKTPEHSMLGTFAEMELAFLEKALQANFFSNPAKLADFESNEGFSVLRISDAYASLLAKAKEQLKKLSDKER